MDNSHEAPELVTIRQFGDMSEAVLAQGLAQAEDCTFESMAAA